MSDNLNAARGSIIIDTSQAEQAPAKMAGVASGINQAMGQVSAGVNQAQAGISQFARTFGIAFGAAGIAQLVRFTQEANAVAVAFDRQTVAARNLAGSQAKLNELLEAYDRATAGAVDRAQALADVTRLQAIGMADNAEQLERLVTAARGASVAMGRSTQDILGEVQLAIANQSFRRLDQIGLGVQEVHQRMDELKASTLGMTTEAAFQEAVIEKLTEKYGALAKSAEALPTGMEAARVSFKNFRLELGEDTKGIVDFTGNALSNWLKDATRDVDLLSYAVKKLGEYLGLLPYTIPRGALQAPGVPSWMTGVSQAASGPLLPAATPEIKATKLDWAKGIIQLNQDTNQQLLDQNRSYQEQRASSEHQFQEATSRAAEDFNLQRQREEQDMADSIARIHSDAARREASEAADLARSIADATSASGERVAKARSDANARLVELDANYERERAKRAQDLNDNLLDAAGQLDAKQVYELQRNAARQDEEAKQAHDDQRDKLQKQLAERLDDEQKSLAKSIQQQQDAYDRRLQDERAADAQRITDMQTAFDKRKTQEDFDYGLRMTRMQQDHNDQLTEMDRQQGLRIQQIKDHAAAERTQLDTEHQTALTKLGVHNQEWVDAETKLNNDALKLLDQILGKGRSLILFPNAGSNTLPFPSMVGANASAYSGTGTGSTYNNSSRTFNPTVNVNIAGGSSLTQKQVDDAVHDALMRVFEETAQ